MSTLRERIYQFCHIGMKTIGVIFFTLFFLSNFFMTAYSLDMTTQKVLFAPKSLLLNILLLVLITCAVFLFLKLTKRIPKHFKGIMLLFTGVIYVLCGLLLLVFSRTVPAADALSVYNCAKQIAAGDLSPIQPTGSYLSYYPQQIGLVAFFELCFRVFHLLPVNVEYYHLLKLIYIVMTFGIVYYLHRLTVLLLGSSSSEEVGCFFLLLCCLNVPLIFYGSFLYSEIPSFLALTFGLYHLTILLGSPSEFLPHSIYSVLGMTLSVLLRKNSLIFIIAVIITILCTSLKVSRDDKKHAIRLLALCALTLFFSLTILPCAIKIYELRAGSHLKSGVPAMSYFAMGMQESSRAAGWYNGFNFNTYDSTGMDTEQTVALSRQAIHDRLNYFSENPAQALRFCSEKFLSQWADGTYACRQATLATYGGRNHFFNELYEGKYSKFFIAYCNAYQLMIAFGCILYLIAYFKKKDRCDHFHTDLLILCAFGGFLFHMIWEANSRYIFLYGLCLLPYCASGFVSLFSMLPWARRIAKADMSGNK